MHTGVNLSGYWECFGMLLRNNYYVTYIDM